MAKGVVGLKIGAANLTAARVSANGSFVVGQVARESLAPGIVSGGEVRDVPELAAALKAFFARAGLPTRGVRVGLASNRIGVRTIELSGIADPKQIANAVRFRAQEALPIPIDQAVLDYHVLDDGVSAAGVPTKRVLIVVAYRDLIDTTVEACKAAGIRLIGIDLEAFALLRALTPPEQMGVSATEERSALVAVAIGSQRSTLAVSDGVSCDFMRVLDWGGEALTAAVAQALELEHDDAERIKRELSLESPDGPEGLTEEQIAGGREALRSALQGFARELVSSLQFYQSQPDSLAIREVLLAGGTARLDGLADALKLLVGVDVRVGDPSVGISLGRKLQPESVDASLAVPIGLGMGL